MGASEGCCCNSEEEDKTKGLATPGTRNAYGDASSAPRQVAPPKVTAPTTSTATEVSSRNAPVTEPVVVEAPVIAPSPAGVPEVPTAPSKPVSFDFILSDLDGAEEVAYGDAFSTCASGKATVMMDCVPFREFILIHTSIPREDLDIPLLQLGGDDTTFTVDGFLHILRENAVSTEAAMTTFLGMSHDGDTIAAEECRNGLLLFCEQNIGANFSEDKWDRIFTTVMWDADRTVTLEKWTFYCKVVGRIVRLVQFAKA